MQHTPKKLVLLSKKGPAFCPAPSAQSRLSEECSALRKEYAARMHDLKVRTIIALQAIDIDGYIAHDAMKWLCK